ncbi:MAG TPA: phosphatase PAP2 family protein [Solirubrobacteraceae bacterium]|nr:phosphatase PAP2 family protein [Solirubrobacteraceae bacterium]
MLRRAEFALVAVAAAVLLLVLTWFLAFHVASFHHVDLRILAGFTDLHRSRVDPIASVIAHLCNPKPFVYLGAAVVLVALVRRRFDVALVVGLILLGANVTTQLLKPLLAAPRSGLPGEITISAVSWPSGHATAAMSLALCSVLAAPARARPAVAAVGALFAIAVSYSFLTLGWHYPSDVLGGYLVASAWTLLGIAALLAVRRRAPAELGIEPSEHPPLTRTLRAPAGALLAAVASAALLFLARPHEVVTYAQAHRTFVIGAAAIAAMGFGLATGVMLTLRR